MAAAGRVRAGARGFVLWPLKEMVDEAYTVYFYVVRAAADAPLECSVVRERWRDEDADSPYVAPASRALARRVRAAAGATWGGVRGLAFEAEGALRTPWSVGRWGVLPDKPGVLFADFGGARHELAFDEWPRFTSTRCSDGQTVHGAMLAHEAS